MHFHDDLIFLVVLRNNWWNWCNPIDASLAFIYARMKTTHIKLTGFHWMLIKSLKMLKI